MTTVAWFVKGSPIDTDYTQGYSNIRFYYQTIVEVCRLLEPKKLYLIGLKKSKREDIQAGGDCSHLKSYLKERSPRTILKIRDYDSEELPEEFDLGFASAMWDKAESMKAMIPNLVALMKKCGEFVYLDSDHELTKNKEWKDWGKFSSFLKHASEDKMLRRKIDEVWATEGSDEYPDVMRGHGYKKLIYCPYIARPISHPPNVSHRGELDWIFIKNPLAWEGKIEPFLKVQGDRCKWYTSPMPAKANKEIEFLKRFKVTTARAKFWKISEVPSVLSEGTRTFHASIPVNKLTSKMHEALDGGVITTVPRLSLSGVGDYFYDMYSLYLEEFERVLVDCQNTEELNAVMSTGLTRSDRKGIYSAQIRFHNRYFSPDNLKHIGSEVI